MDSKGQINIEFIAAAGLFILTLLGLITSSQVLPDYTGDTDRMELNLEAESITTEMLTEEGYHSYGDGGSNWHKNSSTLENTESFGLAQEHHVIDRSKLNRLRTATLEGGPGFNYSQFIETTSAENQYRFSFVWVPTVQTNYSYTKGDPPANPDISEPSTESYRNADNRVHYGTLNVNSRSYPMIVTAHNGVYDSVYVNEISEGWNFQNPDGSQPYGIGEMVQENGFVVQSFQNRESDEGAMVIMEREIKEFGSQVDPNTEVVTLDRYAVMEGEPLRVEVSVW